MMSGRVGLWAGLALAGAALAGCGGSNNNAAGNQAPAEGATTSAEAPPPAAAPPESAGAAQPGTTALPRETLTDPQIVQVVLSANAGDSARGVLAGQKATNPQVTQFGREMVTDHGRLNRETRALAARLKLTPQPSSTQATLVRTVDGMTKGLEQQTGLGFDTTYIDQTMKVHTMVLTELDSALIPQARNGQLKSLLQTARNVVQRHLQRAEQLAGLLTPK